MLQNAIFTQGHAHIGWEDEMLTQMIIIKWDFLPVLIAPIVGGVV